jgi:hypothetical protein
MGQSKMSYCNRHHKEKWGVGGKNFLWSKYIVMLYFCRAKKGGTNHYGLSLSAKKLLRFILFCLKIARENNVLVMTNISTCSVLLRLLQKSTLRSSISQTMLATIVM